MSSVRSDRSLYALLAGFAALAGVMLVTVWLSEQEGVAARLVRHTLQVENQINRVQIELLDAESSQRGYLLSGRTDFLQPYETASSALGEELAALGQATADDPRQVANIARLRATVQTRQALLEQNLDAFRHGAPTASLADRLERGRFLMEEAHRVASSMSAEEDGLLAVRIKDAARRRMLARAGLIVSGLAVLILGAFVFMDAQRRLRQAVSARDALANANEQLREEARNRQAAEDQVRQIQKMQAIGELTGGIAHDFNNMLAIVIGSLDLAKRRLHSDPAKAEDCIDSAAEGAARAAQLTARLLAFSRQQPLSPRVIDVNKLVGGMSEMLRRTIGENLRIETVLAGGLWRTWADPAQLENAIVNLCVNARDAMPDGGRLTIETSNAHLDDAYAAAHREVEAGQYVMISVTDTGTGMPAEVVERAFEPFYTTKGAGRGTGLGLSQIQGFVKQSHGHVKIYSEPGLGTAIKIYLPRHVGEIESAATEAQVAGEVPHGKSDEIILVVEDDERVRHLSVDSLRELGYSVVQAADAVQALTVLTLQPHVDLLFTDVVMPDMDGRRLADKVREMRPQLKVLYTTGYTRNAIVHNGMLDAGVALLAKPFTLEQLARKVRQVLDG